MIRSKQNLSVLSLICILEERYYGRNSENIGLTSDLQVQHRKYGRNSKNTIVTPKIQVHLQIQWIGI